MLKCIQCLKVTHRQGNIDNSYLPYWFSFWLFFLFVFSCLEGFVVVITTTTSPSFLVVFGFFFFFCLLWLICFFLFETMKLKKFYSLVWKYENTSKKDQRQYAHSSVTIYILFWILSGCCSSCKKHFCCPSGQLLHKLNRDQDHIHEQLGNMDTA